MDPAASLKGVRPEYLALSESFFSKWLEYTARQESPADFHFWAAVVSLAAASGRNTWLDMGLFKVFPNHYVILVAGSAACRKSLPLRVSQDVLKNALGGNKEYLFLSGKITGEGLSRALNKSPRKKVIDKKERLASRATTFTAPELGRFLNRQSQTDGIADFLNDLYDCMDECPYITKTQGMDVIPYSYFNVLGATTPTWIRGNISPATFGEGFVGRVIFVYGREPKTSEAIPVLTARQVQLRESMIKHLQAVSEISGPMELSTEARDYYVEWYDKRRDASQLRISEEEVASGFIEREHIHILKLAMIHVLSELSGLIIEKRHIDAAIAGLHTLRTALPLALAGAGAEPEAKHSIRVMQYMSKHRVATERSIKQAMYRFAASAEHTTQTLMDLEEYGMLEKRSVKVAKNGRSTVVWGLAKDDELMYDGEE